MFQAKILTHQPLKCALMHHFLKFSLTFLRFWRLCVGWRGESLSNDFLIDMLCSFKVTPLKGPEPTKMSINWPVKKRRLGNVMLGFSDPLRSMSFQTVSCGGCMLRSSPWCCQQAARSAPGTAPLLLRMLDTGELSTALASVHTGSCCWKDISASVTSDFLSTCQLLLVGDITGWIVWSNVSLISFSCCSDCVFWDTGLMFS